MVKCLNYTVMLATAVFKLLPCFGLGLIPAIILHFIIEGAIIPDPCYYHGSQTTALFDLFYKMESGDGYHPSPTNLNLLLTVFIGLLIGYALYKFFEGLINEQKNEKTSCKNAVQSIGHVNT